ncbi:MAG: GNAT family N-acetyltransferase [Coriobacteriales bacterium]|jgi:ribosomal protein S18 acetylase RimI-like enzyme
MSEITLVRKVRDQTMEQIKRIGGESFADDLLFEGFGTGEERRALVMEYMRHYVDYCYKSKILYANADYTGFVALQRSGKEKLLPTSRFEKALKRYIPPDKLQAFSSYSSEVANSFDSEKLNDHIEVLMLCVDEKLRGRGLGGELMDFSKEQSRRAGVPLIIDTDMPGNRDMYIHMGCTLYRTKKASNGISRYNLIWRP